MIHTPEATAEQRGSWLAVKDALAKSEHWITIGGHEEGSSKHAGGSRVKIDGEGRILAGGPERMRGKKIGDKAAWRDKGHNDGSAEDHYQAGRAKAPKDTNEYTRTIHGVSEVLKHRGHNVEPMKLADIWHDPLAGVHSEDTAERIGDMLQDTLNRQMRSIDNVNTWRPQGHEDLGEGDYWRIPSETELRYRDVDAEATRRLDAAIKHDFPDARRGGKKYKELFEQHIGRFTKDADEVARKERQGAADKLERYIEGELSTKLKSGRQAADTAQMRAEHVRAFHPNSDVANKAEAYAIRLRGLAADKERRFKDALKKLRGNEEAEMKGEETRKSYDAKERKEVKRKKESEYGDRETFAVPSLDSYPLTNGGKPDHERVQAAWDYIHVEKNRAKLGDKAEKAEARIRAFAKKHFPDMTLEGGEETKKSLETYTYPDGDSGALPLTREGQPDADLVRKAWSAIHETRANFLLGDENVAAGERTIAEFAVEHKIALSDEQTAKSWVL